MSNKSLMTDEMFDDFIKKGGKVHRADMSEHGEVETRYTSARNGMAMKKKRLSDAAMRIISSR